MQSILYTFFFYFSLLAFSFLFLIIFLFEKQAREFVYYSLYLFLTINIIASILFLATDIVLMGFLSQIEEPLVVGDPTVFTTNYYNFLLYLTCLFALPIILVYLQMYMSHLNYYELWYLLKYFHYICVYYLMSTFLIIRDDLHIGDFIAMGDLSDMEINLDFQPNFSKFLQMFCELYNQLLGFNIICLFIPFFLIIIGKLTYYKKSLRGFFYKISLVYFIFTWGLFYEYMFTNTLILCILVWLLMLLFHLLWLILEYLVRNNKIPYL